MSELVPLSAQKRLDSLIAQKEGMINASWEIQLNWLESIGTELFGYDTLSNYSDMVKCRLLYEAWDVWENPKRDKRFTDESKSRWGYNFYAWAGNYIRIQKNKKTSRSSIEKRIRVYRNFMVEERVQIPDTIYVPLRDTQGIIIEEEFEQHKFEFYLADFQKLNVVMAMAIEYELPPEIWGMVLDTYVGVSQLARALNEWLAEKWREEQETGNGSNGAGDDSWDFYFNDNFVYASSNGRNFPVLGVMWENSEQPGFEEALAELGEALDVEFPITINI